MLIQEYLTAIYRTLSNNIRLNLLAIRVSEVQVVPEKSWDEERELMVPTRPRILITAMKMKKGKHDVDVGEERESMGRTAHIATTGTWI